MRWDALFADLEAEAEAEAAAERRSEVADRIRAEFARLRLIDRLQPLLGEPGLSVRIGLPAGDAITGSVLSIGADWVLLGQPGTEVELLVPLAAVQWIEGLGPASAEPGWEGQVGARFSLRIALRRLTADRSTIALTLVSGDVRHGRLARVGADHVVVEGAAGTGSGPLAATIPLTAIAYLRRG
jgi:class 3 adenylate cyclase